MANTACFTSVNFISSPSKASNPPSVLFTKTQVSFQNPSSDCGPKSRFHPLKAKAEDSNPSTKPKSILCGDCDGNGAILCTQCKGTGVNSVDHFNGQFKAGGLCWLCRGKREILCGNCNGAGFLGGFMSTFDE